ncbi:MAG: TonB-dependent receptor, partial [bacterium]|nr:TonB-dependent receptor [bacterium]
MGIPGGTVTIAGATVDMVETDLDVAASATLALVPAGGDVTLGDLDMAAGVALAVTGSVPTVNLAGISGLDDLLAGTSGISTDNDVWTGNLGLTVLTPRGINPYVRWAQSYREPEVTVRYLIRNFGSPFFFVTGLPNTELQAEEGETLDFGVKFDQRNWRGTIGFFENDIENFIATTLS